MWPLLAKILVKQIKDRFDDKGSPAGCSAVALCGNIVTPIMMLECRENISSNANESGQRLLADARMAVHQQKIGEIRNVSCMPMFLVSIAGPHMMVQGSMLLDDELIVQPLTDYIYLGCGGPYHHQRIVRVAHVFHALRTCLDSLEVYYRDLVPSTQPDPAQCLPYLTSLPDSTKIEYIEPMMSKKPIFKARRVRDNRPVVVKFVDSYCEEAHRLLAEEGLAPALHHFGPVCPDLYMVVMDFEENIHDAYSMYGPHRLPKPVYTQVARAVNILHRHDFVFGDLRYCNIMVRQLPKADLKAGAFAIDDFDDEDADQVDSVLLLDFDWCGLADKARYPSTLNDAGTISWPEGVKRGGIMRKAHDLAMLESFKFAQFLEQPEQPCVGM
ncbi:hypothetical protein BC835DRAFT_1394330 [Cytidiella melzeri]|nr:hypothetical protein BC835DRAFT_1394330 [Cytidiella melzeri]